MSTISKSMKIVKHPLGRVKSWPLNPRRSDYRNMEALEASLAVDGQEEAVHLWVTKEADWVLRGNRRLRAMVKLGWSECDAVLHEFADEAEAYRFCLRPHGLTDALDSEEKITAVKRGVELGMTTADLAPVLGVTVERVQLFFDLGEMLPVPAREALINDAMSLHVAELLLRIKDAAKRREAAVIVLNAPDTGEPMAFGQARAFIESRYVLPEKHREEWGAKQEYLKKRKLKVMDGFQFVEWEQRLEYVHGDSGQPLPEFELGENFYERDAEGRTWQQVAQDLQVPVYVVPAPRHADGYVTVVSAAMMREARSLPRQSGERRAEGGESEKGKGGDSEKGSDEASDVQVSESPSLKVSADAERLRRWLRVWLSAIYEALVAKPTAVMCNEPWKPLMGFLAHLTTDVDAGALEAWRGISTRAEAEAFIASDKMQRAPLRMALMLLLCAESDAGEEPGRIIREVGVSLGLDAVRLEEMAGGGGE